MYFTDGVVLNPHRDDVFLTGIADAHVRIKSISIKEIERNLANSKEKSQAGIQPGGSKMLPLHKRYPFSGLQPLSLGLRTPTSVLNLSPLGNSRDDDVTTD